MKQSSQILSKWFKDQNFYAKKILGNDKKINKMGEQNALKLFFQACQRVPAYKNFLKANKIKPSTVKTIKDFKKIPPLNKDNYIAKYDLKDRCWDGLLKDVHMISQSSSTTGKSHFWPRDLKSEIDGSIPHELIFKDIFKVNKSKSLFINGFPMGSWIAGTFTQACVNLVSWKGYPLTSVVAGYSLEPVIELLFDLGERFTQVIIIGHTPFLKEVVEESFKKGFNFKKIPVKLLGTGQGITENWRMFILKLLNSKDYHHTFINLYGSADCALMGFETPLSIAIRKFLSDNMAVGKSIFNDERLPALYNFDPRLTFFDEDCGELCITKYSSCPLIRYNIHDHGGVIPYTQMRKILGTDNFKSYLKTNPDIPDWRLPFVYLFGREKFMVKIFGANVYSEHVQMVLDHQKLQPYLSGRFVLEQSLDQDHDPQMICHVELKLDVLPSTDLAKKVGEIFVEKVRKINSEYNYVLNNVGEKVKPKIVLYKHGDAKYFPQDKIKKTA